MLSLLAALLSFTAPALAADDVPDGPKAVEAALRAKVRGFLAEQLADPLLVPSFGRDKDWLNVARPLDLREDLAGKVVVLDFWTYCCINCFHVFDELAWLERRWAGEPVAFVGVHSAKFPNEGQLEQLRSAVARHHLEHAVVNDPDLELWRDLGVRAWPTLALVGPDGALLALLSGEGHREVVDAMIREALALYRSEHPDVVLDSTPLPLRLEVDRTLPGPLAWPGKIAVDAKRRRLYVADTGHHRVLELDLDGRYLRHWGGFLPGFEDGEGEVVRFFEPNGLAVHDGRLLVADTRNHALRAIDLASGVVSTLAGVGTRGQDRIGGRWGRVQELASPWDVVVRDDLAYLANAGTHQIWTYDLQIGKAVAWAGDGTERRLDGPRKRSALAQPSGLALSGDQLVYADSESSSIRAISLTDEANRTLAGAAGEPRNLFAFGDADGAGFDAKLQHPLGVAAGRRHTIWITDTYNHKLKSLDVRTGEVRTWAGGEAGFADGSFADARFDEPADVEVVGHRLFVADTNNHAIRVVDRRRGRVSTLALEGVPTPPAVPVDLDATLPRLPGTLRRRLDPVAVPRGAVELTVALTLPEGRKLNEGAPSAVQIRAHQSDGALAAAPFGPLAAPATVPLTGTAPRLPIEVTDSGLVDLHVLVYHCDASTSCRVDSTVLEVPLQVTDGAPPRVEVQHAVAR